MPEDRPRSIPPLRWLLVALAVALGLSAVGCDDGETEAARDRLQFIVAHDGSVGLPATTPALAEVRFTAWSARTGRVVDERTYSAAAGSRHSLGDLPIEDDLVFFVEGFDASGQLRASGGSRQLRVAADGDGVEPVLMFVVPVGHFARASAPFASGDGLSVSPATFDDQPRAGHAIAELADGRVIVTGGAEIVAEGSGLGGTELGSITDAVLVHDPHTGYFEVARDRDGVPLQMASPRVHHTATLLPGNRILIAGGLAPSSSSGVTTVRSVELLQPDPAGGFELVSLPPMAVARAWHTATARLDGSVLIAGGEAREGTVGQVQSSAELFDPVSNTFTATEPMSAARAEHSATVLADGLSVFIAGGRGDAGALASTEAFLVEGSTLTFRQTPPMSVPRYGHGATRLLRDGGRYLVFAGGWSPMGDPAQLMPTDHVDIVDSFGGAFLPPSSMSRPRADFTFFQVGDDDEVIAAGGYSHDGGGNLEVLQTGERLDFGEERPEFFTIQETENLMSAPRRDAASIVLTSGLVLVSGGASLATSHATSDLYNAGPPPGTTSTATAAQP